MLFHVVQSRFSAPDTRPAILLERTPWDDHGYQTLFRAFLLPEGEGGLLPLGRVKILERGRLSPSLADGTSFTEFGEGFCSLGQDSEYYERILEHFAAAAPRLLDALRDVALRPAIEAAFAEDRGFQDSLLRFPNAELALTRARQLFSVPAQVENGPLEFSFSCQLVGFDSRHKIDFHFPRPAHALGRIMAIAGRNGCGKTQLLARLGHALSGLSNEDTLEPATRRRIVAISFNIFDSFTTPRDAIPGDAYQYFGLRPPRSRVAANATPRASLDHALNHRLKRALRRIWSLGEAHQREWGTLLDSCGLFAAEPRLDNPFESSPAHPQESRERIEAFLGRLQRASAGHQFLVFVVTALVESVRSGSIVLIDEIETHLHPRLLSTVTRVLSDFLVRHDAFAVLATHSPLVLQEVPADSVRLIHLSDRHPIVKRYPRESFGEALDEITQEAFGLREQDRNYVTLLRDLVAETPDRTVIERHFSGLGLSARMLLREILEEGAEA